MKNWFANKKIMVPVDFSEDSTQSLDVALEMADSPAMLHVVHVAPDLDLTTPGVVWEAVSEDSQREHVMASLTDKFSDAKYQGTTYHVTFGDAGRGIVGQAEQVEADVIVMSSHGRTGFERLLIGSVAERVLRLAHLPVIILRH